MTEPHPHDVDPTIWARDGVNRFARADLATIYAIGRGQWAACVPIGTLIKHIKTQRGSTRKFPSAGAAARFLALHHPLKGPTE